jgi:hypothetical protein
MILYNFRPGKHWCGSRYRDRSCSADIGILLPFTHKAEYCSMPQELPNQRLQKVEIAPVQAIKSGVL